MEKDQLLLDSNKVKMYRGTRRGVEVSITGVCVSVCV